MIFLFLQRCIGKRIRLILADIIDKIPNCFSANLLRIVPNHKVLLNELSWERCRPILREKFNSQNYKPL